MSSRANTLVITNGTSILCAYSLSLGRGREECVGFVLSTDYLADSCKLKYKHLEYIEQMPCQIKLSKTQHLLEARCNILQS